MRSLLSLKTFFGFHQSEVTTKQAVICRKRSGADSKQASALALGILITCSTESEVEVLS